MVLTSMFLTMGPAVDGSAIAGLADFGKDDVEDVVGPADIQRDSERVRHIPGGGNPRTRDVSQFVRAGSQGHPYILVYSPGSNKAALKFLNGCGWLGIAGLVGAGFWATNARLKSLGRFPDSPSPERTSRPVVTAGVQLVALEQRSVPTPILSNIASVLTKKPEDMTPADLIVLVHGFAELTMSSAHQSNDWYRVRGLLIETLESGSVESQLKILDEIEIVYTKSQARDDFLKYALIGVLEMYINKQFAAKMIHDINPRTKAALLVLLKNWFDKSETGSLCCMLCRNSLVKLGEVPSK